MLRNPLILLVGGMRFERTTPGFGVREYIHFYQFQISSLISNTIIYSFTLGHLRPIFIINRFQLFSV